MKIGLLGGTFNPVHLGHVNLGRAATEYVGLDKLLVMPTSAPPHKAPDNLPDGGHRLEMLRIAFKGQPAAQVSDMELRRGGTSYTSHTLSEIASRYPKDEIFLVVGSDMFFTLESWYEKDEIKSTARIITMARKAGQLDRLNAECRRLETLGWRVQVLPEPPQAVSSTQVRAGGLSLVPPGVADYIAQNGLYGANADDYPWDYTSLEALARKKLSDHRFTHSKCVEEQAVMLARHWGASQSACRVAGLLHDICKEVPRHEQLQLLSDSARITSKIFMTQPGIWHGYAAAEYLRRELNITSRLILDAVRFHTTARAGMSVVEEIVYLADLTSCDRNYPGVHELRELCRQSLRNAMVYALSYFKSTLTVVCDETAQAFNYYLGG